MFMYKNNLYWYVYIICFKYCSLTNLKDASNPKYYKHLQATHFSFQDMHNINIYQWKWQLQMQDFSFVHKYA